MELEIEWLIPLKVRFSHRSNQPDFNCQTTKEQTPVPPTPALTGWTGLFVKFFPRIWCDVKISSTRGSRWIPVNPEPEVQVLILLQEFLIHNTLHNSQLVSNFQFGHEFTSCIFWYVLSLKLILFWHFSGDILWWANIQGTASVRLVKSPETNQAKVFFQWGPGGPGPPCPQDFKLRYPLWPK